MTKQNEDKAILSKEELSKLEQCIKSGFSNLQAIYETGIAEERFDRWYVHFSGHELIKRWRVMRTAPALKIFHDPTNHKEAEAVLKRSPDTKKAYSERTEHTGAEGKDLQPILVRFIDGNTDTD
jgi:hypothetical protein